MAERSPLARIWIGRASYLAIAVVLMFLHLLPLDTVPRRWAPPDWLLIVTFAWVARRPDYVPVLLIALVMLLSDLLFHRPPGLWTGIVLICAEGLRRRSADLRAVPFPLEWLTIALVICAAVLANRFLLAVSVTPQAPLSLAMVEMVVTILAYPIVTWLSYLAFGVTRPAPGAVDALGHRI
ncbi:membrane protein, putative [Oceanicola granulosus HTCC2516]|uniref:Membrane protein, putative n=1 Tax=Oceanicola granulosus (strain ATCC BAA-861 / DSM 15982 / KCTC 12143 / HTCC2516) TaxID=314256 RepID=Q2CGZ8_OCEGH|nr:hypothetical protein [Oceanicola granulosus]EAR52013.1 membrane protein, putative [Oceanicola granulosus HTCC2516]